MRESGELMSVENVKRFYAELKRDEELENEALALQAKYADQEKVIEAFLLLARERGFLFTEQDLVTYLYENGKDVSDSR